MSYAFTAAAPVTILPRARARPAVRPAPAAPSDWFATMRDAAGAVIILGLAAAPTAFTIAVILETFGLRIL